jgi:hypothetical protein
MHLVAPLVVHLTRLLVREVVSRRLMLRSSSARRWAAERHAPCARAFVVDSFLARANNFSQRYIFTL